VHYGKEVVSVHVAVRPHVSYIKTLNGFPLNTIYELGFILATAVSRPALGLDSVISKCYFI
jgi:hypothetical protein